MAQEKKKAKILEKLASSAKYFRDCFAEIRKIVWPTPKTALKNMSVVLISMIVIGLLVFGLDTLFGTLLGLIMDIAA